MNINAASLNELSIAYLVLAHEDPDQVAELVGILLKADPTGNVVVHYDLKRSKDDFAALKARFAHESRAWFVDSRAKCEWGGFGLVDGVVRALRVVRKQQIECDYVYLLSGSCMPTKPLAMLKRFLSENRGAEFIEANPANWIVGGLREERYQYRHWFSFRTNRPLFEISYRLQRTLGLKRKLPRNLQARFGSQWWCLTRETCFGILEFIEKHPNSYAFFKNTWIPDELFFQTMATSIATEVRIANTNLTLFKFTPKGRPISFFDDHLEVAPRLPYFFVRKVAPTASRLRAKLGEIAAAPDDGGDFPALDMDESEFDYEKLVANQIEDPRPGQMFYGGQSFTGWPSSLAQSRIQFVVLHGPPAVTRIVREHLRQTPGLTLLGRVLNPEKVELEASGKGFEGFTSEDSEIRDLDPPLYLSRLLARADGLPVVEICPCDAPHAEGHFYFSHRALFISCQPDKTELDASRRLYWSLAAIAHTSTSSEEWSEAGSDAEPGNIAELADALIGRTMPSEHKKWVDEMLLGRQVTPRFLRLTWGAGARATGDEPLVHRLSKLQAVFGPAVAPLVAGLRGIDGRLAALRPTELTAALPDVWRDYFSKGAGETWDGWASALQTSPVGYGVIYGPPALTRIVTEHLRGARDVSLLGRVFGPPNAEPSSHEDLPSLPDGYDPELLRRDRPLFLARLFAASKGFPVIEVCPGDEPAGEAYLFADENSIFMSCQPRWFGNDDTLSFYWALSFTSGFGHELGISDFLPNRASRKAARTQLDLALDRYISPEHRKWVTRNILEAIPTGASLRLVAGGATGLPPLPFEVERVHRLYGAAGTPVAHALAGLDAKLSSMTLESVAEALPDRWQAYFLASLEADTEWRTRREPDIRPISEIGRVAAAFPVVASDYRVEFAPDSPSTAIASRDLNAIHATQGEGAL